MPGSFIRLEAFSFSYESSEGELLREVTLSFKQGWTGIVGANGAGKSTLLRLAAGQIEPTAGRRTGAPPSQAIYCDQRTDEPPEDLAALLSSVEADACRLRGSLELEDDWADRWPTLSHGERKRAQLAVALWKQPEVLAVDEPTNHLDLHARALIEEALRSYDGIGLLVSHDRSLLDSLCRQCVFVDPPQAISRPGGYSAGASQAVAERETLSQARALADREVRKLKAEAVARRDQSLKNERQRSKRGVDKADHDTKARINLAKVSDGKSGQRLRQLDGRVAQALERKQELVVKKDHLLGVSMPGQRAPRDKVVFLEPTSLPLGPGRALSFPSLLIQREDRIGIKGPNGSGKSSLLRHLVASWIAPRSRLAYLPQEIDAEQSRQILLDFRGLPRDRLGLAMSLVSRLGSRPERLLQSETPSPGEVRKMLLASSMVADPYLIILDEPTNHLDLPSIEQLEQALEGTRAALVIVSHDPRFLERLTSATWSMVPAEDRGSWRLEIAM